MSDYAELIQNKIDQRRAKLEEKEKKDERNKVEQVNTELSLRDLQLSLDAINSKINNRTLYDMNNERSYYDEEHSEQLLPTFTVSDFDSFNQDIIIDKNGEKTIKYNILREDNIAIIQVDCWVYDKKEEIIDKFKNIYSAFASRGDALAIIIKRTVKGSQFYFALRSTDKDRTDSGAHAFMSSVCGNFPGTKVKSVRNTRSIFDIDNAESVAIVTGVGSEKSEKGISQGIEKLLNGINPTEQEEEYTIVYLAESVSNDDLQKIRNGYETMASEIYPYTEYQESVGTAKSITEGTNSSISNMKGVNRAIAKTNGTSLAINFSTSSSETKSEGSSDAASKSETEQESTNRGNVETDSQAQMENHTDQNSINTNRQTGTAVQSGTVDTVSQQKGTSTTDTFGTNTSGTVGVTVGASVSAGVNVGVAQASVSASVSESLSVTTGVNSSTSSAVNFSDSFSQSLSESTSISESQSVGQTIGTAVSKGMTTSKSSAISYATGIAKGIAVATTNTIIKSVANTVGISAGGSMGFQRSTTKTQGTSSSRTETNGVNYCVSDSITTNTTKNIKSYPVAETIKKIEKQIERTAEFEALGAWKHAIYVFGTGRQTYNVANFLKGLLQGDESFVENFVVNRWEKKALSEDVENIKKYVEHLCHPIMYRTLDVYAMMAEKRIPLSKEDGEFTERHLGNLFLGINAEDIEITTPTTYISSAELARTMSFPYKSVQGLSSINCVEFGRNIIYKNDLNTITEKSRNKSNKKIPVGKVNFMNSVEDHSVIELDVNSLTKHTFVTGSTGSGKSTAIYTLLHRLRKEKVKFLVVEPAKGEYKYEFKDKDVTVYNTNGRKGKLLRINPFYFPSDSIMVFEHIDRLIEIFNVCWPMYAAMPAVLKEAVELAYKDAGWDLKNSINPYGDIFPTFIDVLKKLKEVIDQSAFSQEVKSNYVGSLVTRIKSLTNGIFGQIFTANNLTDKELFESNVIVDLSRVGSAETKSMVMGLLVMRMQEYYMSKFEGQTNNELRHVTVLEEAHNILKRVSTEQTSESANLIGKSVEMISNAIAEMRTYGEGFIIADQSPSLMDMSVIRNTNTKLLFNLPDQTDRELTGLSMGLNDDQIGYLSKLSTGVCAIYQNEWVESSLCNFDKENIKVDPLNVRVDGTDPVLIQNDENDKKALVRLFRNCYNPNEGILSEEKILAMNIPTTVKIVAIEYLRNPKVFSPEDNAEYIKELFYNDRIAQIFTTSERKLSLVTFDADDDYEKEQITRHYMNYWKKELEIPVEEGKAGICIWLLIVTALLNAYKNEGNSVKHCAWLINSIEQLVYGRG